MKPSLQAAARALDQAQEAYAAGQPGRARPQLEQALELLLRLRPSTERDTLLAQAHLGLHVLTQLGGQQGRSERHLRWGVSYARTAGDGPTRTQAQQLWRAWEAQSESQKKRVP